MLYCVLDKCPQLIGDDHFIAESAEVIGSVTIENHVCILPQVVIRADNDTIHIREGTNIQDGSIIHTDVGVPMKIGKHVTIAHKVVLHGCQIGDFSLIGIGTIVLNHAVIGKNCIIGANSLILENEKIPDGSFVVGSPAKIIKQLTCEQIDQLKLYAQHYMEKISVFRDTLKPMEYNLTPDNL